MKQKTLHSFDMFAFIGGRKFVISILGMMSLIIMASMNPMAVTTEVVIGIIGIVATFSGSNSVVTAIMAKMQGSSTAPSASIQPETLPQDATVPVMPGVVSDLEPRVQALENAMNEMISIIKAQNDTLNRLTIAQNKSSLVKDGQNRD